MNYSGTTSSAPSGPTKFKKKDLKNIQNIQDDAFLVCNSFFIKISLLIFILIN